MSLRLRDGSRLDALLHQIYDPRSRLFHHFLTPRQFARRFAPSNMRHNAVARWLESVGLRVVQQYSNGLAITVEAPAGLVGTALHVALHGFALGGRKFFSSSVPARIPAAVAHDVQSISGLDNLGQSRSSERNRAFIRPAIAARTGGNGLPVGLAPDDLARIYNLTPLRARGIDGSNTTIALEEFSDFSTADIAFYDSTFGRVVLA